MGEFEYEQRYDELKQLFTEIGVPLHDAKARSKEVKFIPPSRK